MSISENIKNLREKKNLSQEQLAQSVSVSRPMISQIERGTKIPSMVLAISLAEALDCSIGELYGQE